MPVIRTILKKARQQAVVKIVGDRSAGSSDGTSNIGPLELKLLDETLDVVISCWSLVVSC